MSYKICHCTKAGTEACKTCSNYTAHIGVTEGSFTVKNNLKWSVGEPSFKGIFISDKLFIMRENGENVPIEDWLKGVIKEAIAEMESE